MFELKHKLCYFNALILFMWLINLYDYEPSEWMCDYSMLLWAYLWYDDFHYMIIWYEKCLNMSMCILEIYVVLVYEIVENKYIDWWSFGVSGGAIRIESSTWGHPTRGEVKWSSPSFVIILDPCNEFYIKLLLFGYNYSKLLMK
jgi:hypothetical protein